MTALAIEPATVEWLKGLSRDDAAAQFKKCCGSQYWYTTMAEVRPFAAVAELLEAADKTFDAMPREAWLEAFASHPRIGDLDSLRMKFAGNKEWSAGEQSGIGGADDATLAQLSSGNNEYAEKFGYSFIVCATGKSADEMLALLEARLDNDPDKELTIAGCEQRKITHLRLAKLQPET